MEISVKIIVVALALLGITRGFKLDFHRRKELFKVSSFTDPAAAASPSSSSVGDNARLAFLDHTPAGVLRVRAGEPFVLDCEAGGSPSPTIHFLKDGHRVIQGADHEILDDEARFEDAELGTNEMKFASLQLSSTKARLVLPCVTSQHEGEYTCVAQTQYQRISTTTYIEVVEKGSIKTSHHHRRKLTRRMKNKVHVNSVSQNRHLTSSLGKNSPQTEAHGNGECLLKRLGDGSPARIHMWTSQRLEFEGSNVQLFCRTSGSPAPKVTWFDRDGDKITPDDNDYKVLGNGDLLIRNIGWIQHMGLFKCEAENGDGKDEVSTFLYPTAP